MIRVPNKSDTRWNYKRKLIEKRILQMDETYSVMMRGAILVEYCEVPILHIYVSPQKKRKSMLIRTYADTEKVGEPDIGVILSRGIPIYYITHMTDMHKLEKVIQEFKDKS